MDINLKKLAGRKYCKCGCNQEILYKSHHKYYGIPDYISGHQFRGKKYIFSEQHKQNLIISRKGKYNGDKNPFYGKHHTEESKQKSRLKMIGRLNWKKGLTKEIDMRVKKQSENMKGIIFTEDHKRKISETRKKLCQEGKIKPWNKDKKGVQTAWNKGKKCEYTTLRNKLDNPTKKIEVRKKISSFQQGIPLHQWKEFIGSKPYTADFNKQFKEAIRSRDGYACKLCMIFEEDHIKLYHKKLVIHHINYDKTLTIKENTITLCNRCNLLVNKDRELWTKHFQEMLKRDYGYQYTIDQKPIMILNGVTNNEY